LRKRIRTPEKPVVDFIVATAPASEIFQPSCRPGSTGKAILLGTGQTPLQVMPGMMIGAERTLTGSFRQHTAQTERALQFSHLFQTCLSQSSCHLKGQMRRSTD
jgi:alcohol dehydrogenase